MNPQDPLANLHPLREPELISWWPLAPGWWLLLIVVVITLTGLCYWLLRRHRDNAYRRQALSQLEALYRDYQARGDNSKFVSGVNALLKRVALTAYPAAEVAARHSESWHAFLDQHAPSGAQFHQDFATATYRQICPDLDMTQLHQTARHWIRQHRRAA